MVLAFVPGCACPNRLRRRRSRKKLNERSHRTADQTGCEAAQRPRNRRRSRPTTEKPEPISGPTEPRSSITTKAAPPKEYAFNQSSEEGNGMWALPHAAWQLAAAPTARRSSEVDPQLAQAYLKLGEALEKPAMLGKAVESYQKYLAMSPTPGRSRTWKRPSPPAKRNQR